MKIFSLLFLVMLVVLVLPHHALAKVYLEDTDIVLSNEGVTLRVLAGSAADVVVGNASVSLTLAQGQNAILRYPGPSPRRLDNNVGLQSCSRVGEHNQFTLVGPLSGTFTPLGITCPPNTSLRPPAFVVLQTPNGGETLKAGDRVSVFWTSNGDGGLLMRILFSTDGGISYPWVLAPEELNDGIADLVLPSVPTTSQARLKIEAWQQQVLQSFHVSDAVFTVQGTTSVSVSPIRELAPPPALVVPRPYVAEQEVSLATSIDLNQNFPEVMLPKGTVSCLAGSRIKGSNAAVYYCGRDGKRHAFPNQATHDSWFAGFGGVITLSDSILAGITLGANVLYRPGLQMIKIQTDPKVYALTKNGTLRWVKTEDMAEVLYGRTWRTLVHDLSDAFFSDYNVGDPVP